MDHCSKLVQLFSGPAFLSGPSCRIWSKIRTKICFCSGCTIVCFDCDLSNRNGYFSRPWATIFPTFGCHLSNTTSIFSGRCTSGFVSAADLFRLIKCASVRLRTCCPSNFQTLFYVVFFRGFVPGRGRIADT